MSTGILLSKPKFVANLRFVRIPTRVCLNLAAAVNVVLYDRACKSARVLTHNA